MVYRTIRNDMFRNKMITLTTMFFVAAASMLVSLAAILVVNLTGAIDTLMNQAKTPHFLQMHAGDIDSARLAAFVAENHDIDEYQVLEFLNIDGAMIRFEEGSLAGSIQDNGLSTQSEQFDFLLDLDGTVIHVSDGQIYVPISYMQAGLATIGDKVQVSGKEFTVAGFARDSQMNSLLSTSKRFLVSENDYAALRDLGSVEYLIEFRLTDLTALSEFESAYIAAGLEANGATVTYPLFKLLNGLSDGMMIGVILLVSALIIAVAFLCIRFTLLAKIEEDYREIGVMKAIGLRVSDIKQIYLAKYAAIAALGSILGFALSFLFRGMLLENIRLYMGESDNAAFAMLFGMLSVLLVFLAIIAYVNGVLRRFRNISPAEAIRFGMSNETACGGARFSLSKSGLLGTNLFLGMKDVLVRRKIYLTMLAVLVISAFIIIVPQNLHHTLSSNDFITYMGVGISDLRIDVQQTDNIPGKVAEIVAAMENESAIAHYAVLTTKTFGVQMDDGTQERIKVELGDHSIFPLTYATGRAPAAENEIALSVMNADELGKQVDDDIRLIVDGSVESFTVSGTYSDVTNGGKTAKAAFSDRSAETMWSVISATLTDESLIDATVAEYAGRFSYAKVSNIDEYMAQTYGATIRSIGKAAYAAMALALTITMLITLLFMKMLVAKDRYEIAVMKAFGFTNADIKAQYVARSLFILILGISLGTVLANTLGEALTGSIIVSFGASSFDFVVNPLAAFLISPLLMGGAVFLATILGTQDAAPINLSKHMKQ